MVGRWGSGSGGSWESGRLTGPGNPSQTRSDSGFGFSGSNRFGQNDGNMALAGQAAGGDKSYMDVRVPPGTMPTMSNPYIGTMGSSAQGRADASAITNGMYGPQQQIVADQIARQRDQLGLIGVTADHQSGILTRDNALAQQALGLDRQGLGIDKDLIGTQQANLGKLRDILKQQYGLNDRTLNNTLKQLGIDEAGLRDMADRKQWDLRSDLTARGAFNTVANERGTGRISRDLMYGLGGIGTQRESAQISHSGNRLGLDEKGIGYDNQAASLNAGLAKIGLDFQRLGISEQQLANGLADGLQSIGLGQLSSILSNEQQMAGLTSQQASLLSTIAMEAMAMSNLFTPQQLAQMRYVLGASGGSTKTRQSAGGYKQI